MDSSKDIQQNTNKQLQSVMYKQKYKKLLAMMGQRKNISGETINGTIDRKNPDKGVVNILLTTHGARLRCFVDQICETYDKNIWFKNCCILKLSLSADDHQYGRLSMVHEGSVTHREDAIYYIVGDHQTNQRIGSINGYNDVVFEPVIFPINRLNLIPGSIKNDYNIYMIRHGESLHNLPTSQHNVVDTSLTPIGIAQAEAAGKTINSLDLKKIDYMFCSNLKRTRETLIHCIKIIRFKNLTNIPDKVIVLPCSHEITYVDETDCDQKQNQSDKIYLENVSMCLNDRHRNECTINSIPGIDLSASNLSIDWTYENGLTKCNDKKNMIVNMINIINAIKNV